MCGIAGIWNIDGRPINRAGLERFTDSLAHRGPDGRGFYIDPDETLGLGHRRLAILDITEKGAQPMSSPDGRYHISYNGEVYNFLELRRELEADYDFSSDTDTEVILAAYVKWGEECQFKLNGMWAFAVWDSHEKKLFLSRDRYGIKPLHYHVSPERLVFASELKAFRYLENFNICFDEKEVAAVLQNPNISEGTERSIIEGISQLKPGYSLSLKKGGRPAVKRWWISADHLEDISGNFEDNTQRFRELFLDACRIRMRSDVPIGTSLSGGLDSSSVICGMKHIASGANARQAGDWQRAFVISYTGTWQDESRHARKVIDYTGLKGLFVDLRSDCLLKHFDDVLYSNEGIQDVHVGPWIVYRYQRENGVVVSMDGHGGDELLAGYVDTSGRKNLKGQTAQTLLNMMPFFVLKALMSRTYSRGNPLLSRQEDTQKTWIRGDSAFSGIVFNEDEKRLFSEKGELYERLYKELHYTTLPVILKNFDRCSMAHGVEVRTPFLDWRLVSFAFSLPSLWKLKGRYTKYILRKAMDGIMPDSITWRKSKQGFGNPTVYWLMNDLKNFILDNVNSTAFLNSGIWDGNMIRAEVENIYKLKKDNHYLHIAWRIIQAVRLFDMFKGSTSGLR